MLAELYIFTIIIRQLHIYSAICNLNVNYFLTGLWFLSMYE